MRTVTHFLPLTSPAVDVNTIFRGNTLATKCMEQYMQFTGVPFLHACLGDALNTILRVKQSCEMDSSKVWLPLNVMTYLKTTLKEVDVRQRLSGSSLIMSNCT